MDDRPSLPPVYAPRPLAADDDPFQAAVALARGDCDAGTLCYQARPDRLAAALVLRPETPLKLALQVHYVMLLAVGDGVGAAIPAQIGVQFAWPDRVLVNGAVAGHLRLAAATDEPDQVPQWMVAGLELDVLGDTADPDPGRRAERTSLYEEGAGDTGPRELLESIARHFLSWLNVWERDGLDPLARAATGRIEPEPAGISPAGDLITADGGAQRALALADILTQAADTAPSADP